MNRKPHDLLEFYRRTSGQEPAEDVTADPAQPLQKTERMLVVRRSQAIVAAASATLLVVLAFVLGLAIGDSGTEPVPVVGGWVIKVVSYRDTDAGRKRAKSVMSQLQKLGWGEVTLQMIADNERLAVTLGSWVQRPHDSKARGLLKRVAKLSDLRNDRLPFKEAAFWQIKNKTES